MVQQRNLADMPGLDLTIREVVRAYRQQVLAPASAVHPDMQVTLPVPSWAEAAFVNNGSLNYSAGQAAYITALQVPGDERNWLDGIQVFRDSGDNTVDSIQIIQPDGYGSGSRECVLIAPGTAGVRLWWPDPGDGQAIIQGLPVGPLLLEPLALVQVRSSGAGVGASVFDYQLFRRRMKLTRAQAP